MTQLSTWITPLLDVAVMAMLAALLWRLRRDPAAVWQAHEARLRELFETLRVLAAQSEGVARELDAALATHQTALRVLLRDTSAAARRVAVEAEREQTPDRDALVGRVRRLAAEAMPIDEIARRLEMPAAEVRVLVGLHAERGTMRGGTRAAARA